MADSNAKHPEHIQAGLAFERPLLALEQKIQELRSLSATAGLVDLSSEVVQLEERLEKQTKEVYSQLSPWERVNVARHANRPLASDYIEKMLDDFVELHGDRVFGDDRAIVTGLACMEGQRDFVSA